MLAGALLAGPTSLNRGEGLQAGLTRLEVVRVVAVVEGERMSEYQL